MWTLYIFYIKHRNNNNNNLSCLLQFSNRAPKTVAIDRSVKQLPDNNHKEINFQLLILRTFITS